MTPRHGPMLPPDPALRGSCIGVTFRCSELLGKKKDERKKGFDDDAGLRDCLGLLVELFPIKPVFKSAQKERDGVASARKVMAGMLLHHMAPGSDAEGSTQVVAASTAAGGGLLASLVEACAADIEDHLTRFLTGSRQWIFDEYFK
jgi:hypothetical protein